MELSVRKDCLRNLSTLISDEAKYFQISPIICSPHVVPILKSGNGEWVAVDALLELYIYPAGRLVLLWHKRAMSKVEMTLWRAVQWKTLERWWVIVQCWVMELGRYTEYKVRSVCCVSVMFSCQRVFKLKVSTATWGFQQVSSVHQVGLAGM